MEVFHITRLPLPDQVHRSSTGIKSTYPHIHWSWVTFHHVKIGYTSLHNEQMTKTEGHTAISEHALVAAQPECMQQKYVHTIWLRAQFIQRLWHYQKLWIINHCAGSWRQTEALSMDWELVRGNLDVIKLQCYCNQTSVVIFHLHYSWHVHHRCTCTAIWCILADTVVPSGEYIFWWTYIPSSPVLTRPAVLSSQLKLLSHSRCLPEKKLLDSWQIQRFWTNFTH